MNATHFDNRGTKQAPFGFVYFDDGARVGYAPKVKGRELFPFEGPYWKPATGKHCSLAKAFLAEQGIAIDEAAQ